jgi:23S rRNA (guanosine2251-2'-O)-methyltransferase
MSKVRENIIYGRKPLLDAITDGKRIDRILLQKGLAGEEISKIKSASAQAGISIQFVPIEKIERVAGRPQNGKEANHQGVIGFLSMVEYYSLDDVIHYAHENESDPLLLILDGVTDVHNIGAIGRSAECFGVHGLVVPETGSAQINPEAIKASAGALTKINICREKSLVTAVKYLKAHGLKIFGADMHGAKAIADVDFNGPCAIVMGAEGEGISEAILRLCDENIKIPMKGKTESLNVSVSAGVILYEVMKQRGE